MTAPPVPLATLIDDLVAANRILAGLAVVDGFGHVSVRHPHQPDRYLLSRSRAPEQIERDDIMTFDLASNAQGGDTRNGYLERFIHGEIYARRPDVTAVVHAHSAPVVPFAASSVPLRPIFHMSGFLAAGAPIFEMRERFGMTDLLVRSREQGAALADTLGTGHVVLMRGHGFCAVGGSIEQAVYRAYYTQQNAELQQRAIALGGDVAYLSPEEGSMADTTNTGVIGRPWALWKARFAP
ncbi:MAG: class II aldolase/adducin family protein [Proteobacteria bacterium]|nr:class II aldolase/adducin family protein [Pseudomonadota bacterium]